MPRIERITIRLTPRERALYLGNEGIIDEEGRVRPPRGQLVQIPAKYMRAGIISHNEEIGQ